MFGLTFVSLEVGSNQPIGRRRVRPAGDPEYRDPVTSPPETPEFRYTDPRLTDFLLQYGVDLVLDVGANRGQFAIELRRGGYSGRIISFEPLVVAHAKLVVAAAGDEQWAVAERCALGDHEGTSVLNIAGNSESSSLLPMLEAHSDAAPASRYIDTGSVPLHRLDGLVLSDVAAAERPFLKLDVQGMEQSVLDGAPEILQRLIGAQVELDLIPLYEGAPLIEEVIASMRERGFSLVFLRPGFTDRRTGHVLQADGIFFRSTFDGEHHG